MNNLCRRKPRGNQPHCWIEVSDDPLRLGGNPSSLRTLANPIPLRRSFHQLSTDILQGVSNNIDSYLSFQIGLVDCLASQKNPQSEHFGGRNPPVATSIYEIWNNMLVQFDSGSSQNEILVHESSCCDETPHILYFRLLHKHAAFSASMRVIQKDHSHLKPLFSVSSRHYV